MKNSFLDKIITRIFKQPSKNSEEKSILSKINEENNDDQKLEPYRNWLKQYHIWLKKISPDISLSENRITAMASHPSFSILVPTYNSDIRLFDELICSIRSQTYPYFEICISDDASKHESFKDYLKNLSSKDTRFKVRFSEKNSGIAANTNRAIKMATGDFIVFCDHDDRMELFALEFFADYINRHPDADVIYSDEDLLNANGERHSPRLQPDWNPDMLTSHMYCPHLVTVRRKLAEDIGQLNSELDGSQDYDFVLRATEKARHIGHVPLILYSWRSAPGSVASDPAVKIYAYEAGRKAVEKAMQRRGEDAVVVSTPASLGVYRVKRKIIQKDVSHIIECRTKDAVLCAKSIQRISPVPIEIIMVVENGCESILDGVEKETDIKVVYVPKGSNRAAAYNHGAKTASSRFLFFSSNDIEIVDSEYPFAAIEHAQRSEIGAVGVKIIYPDGRYYHTGMILGVNGLCGYAHRYTFQGPGFWNFAVCIRNYSAVSWDIMAVEQQKWEKTGGFDENLAFYADVDFCLKLIRNGYRNIYTPYLTAVLKKRAHLLEELRNDEAAAVLIERYGKSIINDPCYHPMLSKKLEDFTIPVEGEL